MISKIYFIWAIAFHYNKYGLQWINAELSWEFSSETISEQGNASNIVAYSISFLLQAVIAAAFVTTVTVAILSLPNLTYEHANSLSMQFFRRWNAFIRFLFQKDTRTQTSDKKNTFFQPWRSKYCQQINYVVSFH